MASRLFVICPVHNRRETTREFLASVQAQGCTGVTCIIVDDGSTDGTGAMVRSEFPEAVLVEGDGDLFWSGAINAGLKHLRDNVPEQDGDLVAFANDDTTMQADCLRTLMGKCRDGDDAYHALTHDGTGRCVSSGGRVLNWGIMRTLHPFRGQAVDAVAGQPDEVIDLATARLLMFPRRSLRAVPGVDSRRFPHYGGDNDFSLSLARHGIRVWITTEARVQVDMSGHHRRLGLAGFLRSLWSIRSTNNLRIRLRVGLKHCPRIWLPMHLCSVVVRVLVGGLSGQR